jgi:ABC-type amino acid transport substrate-binding protein
MGYSIDLCQRVVAGLQQKLELPQIDVKWVEVNTANRFERVADGTIDLECGTSTITLSRQKQVNFSLMTWADGGSFLVKPDFSVRALADLTGKKIAVIQGTTTDRALRQALKDRLVNAEVVPVKEHLDGLNAVAKGAADAYASDQTVLVGLAIAVSGQIQLKMAEMQFSFEPYGLTLRRNDPDFKLAVDEVLARLYRSGQILDIYDRWFGKLGKPSPAIFAVYNLAGLPE